MKSKISAVRHIIRPANQSLNKEKNLIILRYMNARMNSTSKAENVNYNIEYFI